MSAVSYLANIWGGVRRNLRTSLAKLDFGIILNSSALTRPYYRCIYSLFSLLSFWFGFSWWQFRLTWFLWNFRTGWTCGICIYRRSHLCVCFVFLLLFDFNISSDSKIWNIEKTRAEERKIHVIHASSSPTGWKTHEIYILVFPIQMIYWSSSFPMTISTQSDG